MQFGYSNGSGIVSLPISYIGKNCSSIGVVDNNGSSWAIPTYTYDLALTNFKFIQTNYQGNTYKYAIHWISIGF